MGFSPESLPLWVLWHLEASPGSLILGQGRRMLRAPQRPKATIIPRLFIFCPPIWLHMTLFRAHEDSRVVHRDGAGKRRLTKQRLSHVSLGQKGPVSHHSQGVFRPGPQGHKGDERGLGSEVTLRKVCGVWGDPWGLGTLPSLRVPMPQPDSSRIWSVGCHPMSPSPRASCRTRGW